MSFLSTKYCLHCMKKINLLAGRCPHCLEEGQGVWGRLILVSLGIFFLLYVVPHCAGV